MNRGTGKEFCVHPRNVLISDISQWRQDWTGNAVNYPTERLLGKMIHLKNRNYRIYAGRIRHRKSTFMPTIKAIYDSRSCGIFWLNYPQFNGIATLCMHSAFFHHMYSWFSRSCTLMRCYWAHTTTQSEPRTTCFLVSDIVIIMLLEYLRWHCRKVTSLLLCY